MNLFILGLGYAATIFASRMRAEGWHVGGTVRSPDKARSLRAQGLEALAFEAHETQTGAVAAALRSADALLVSIPPSASAEPPAESLAETVAHADKLHWIGYLSTIGVYGDHGGAWIDETTPCAPVSERSRARLRAEQQWTALGARVGKPVVIFRLPGIYGPSRNALAALREGTARRIVKPGQVFNRVHVEDIASALALSVARDSTSAVYNLTDDEPAPPQDVVAYAAALLGVEPPAEIPFEHAKLSAMAASFYGENKRARNTLIKDWLGFKPAYPSYREGLRALFQQGEGRS
jgi:nucleoside-diphosphate-sugar epimerase